MTAVVVAVTDLQDKLCFSVGGISNQSNSSALAFTGEAPKGLLSVGVWAGSIIAGGAVGALLAL